MSKQKIKVLTYGQVIKALTEMVATGRRDINEPFKNCGQYVPDIVDTRTGEVLAVGELEVEVNRQPPISL